MAAPSRRTDAPVTDAESLVHNLFESGYRFEFFQAVRLLSRLRPNARAVATTAKPADEVCRFAGHASLAFPASAIHTIEEDGDGGRPAAMTVAFMGLFGSQGVMPVWYTERIIGRRTVKDGVLEAFFNLFNHRFISLFYRAWEKHRPAVQYELTAVRGDGMDPFTAYLYDLIGMGTKGLRGRLQKIAAPTLLLYGGLIAQRPHSAAALRCILRDYFRIAVTVEQFAGAWYEIEEADRAWLWGEADRNRLGVGAFIGRRVWDQQARIRIRLGPLPLRTFCEFLPGSEALSRLAELTRFLLGPAVAFDVQPVLRAAGVPGCRLTARGNRPPRLGQMSWLKTREFRRDADDAVFAHVR